MTDRPHMLTTRRPRHPIEGVLAGVLFVMIIVGVSSLLIEHGFRRLPLPLWLLWTAQSVAAIGLLGDRIARVWIAADRRDYVRRHWVDVVLIVASVAIGAALPGPVVGALLAAKAYILSSLLFRGLDLYVSAASSGMHPARMLGASFLFCILIGTGLLMLPRAVPDGEEPLYQRPPDALFTATSATCVTGLIVRDTGTEFSRFGQTVILCLIQLGGLGIMTFGTIFLLLGGRALGLRHQAMMGQALSDEPVGQIARTVKFVVIFTLIVEGLGVWLLYGLWAGEPDGLFYAVFHSISAFCNAGFSLHRDSFTAMRDTWQVLLAVPALVIIGGIGFPVLMDVLGSIPGSIRYMRNRRRRWIGVVRPRWTLHTKLVLTTTAALLVFGSLGLIGLETNTERLRVGAAQGPAASSMSDWERLNIGGRIRQGWFQSVSARTAGFNTIELKQLSPAGKLWMIGLMAVGGSPASTAGGVKTVTLAVLVLLVWSSLRGRQNVEAYNRTFSDALLRRAVTLAILFAALIMVTTLSLAWLQGSSSKFIDLLFESVSACGTVGMSLGETGRLVWPSKIVLAVAMFVGRVGPLTLLLSLTSGGPPARYRYPNENLVVG